MKLFKSYSKIKDFLIRFTIIKIGKLHIRIHKIIDIDKSTLYHNHPFHYMSIILWGGYTESILKDNIIKIKKNNFLNIITRKNTVYHRIEKVKPNTVTLFITWGKYKWSALNTVKDNSTDGIYERIINGKKVWSKRENGIWFIGNPNKEIASKETRHSIHQIL